MSATRRAAGPTKRSAGESEAKHQGHPTCARPGQRVYVATYYSADERIVLGVYLTRGGAWKACKAYLFQTVAQFRNSFSEEELHKFDDFGKRTQNSKDYEADCSTLEGMLQDAEWEDSDESQYFETNVTAVQVNTQPGGRKRAKKKGEFVLLSDGEDAADDSDYAERA